MADLVVDDLALRLAGNDVLKAVSLTVPAGKVVALLGPSGSGKTTLLRAVAGLAAPHHGAIRVGDTLLYDAAKRVDVPAEKRGLGLVFQSYALWPHRTVAENVAYGLTLRGVAKTDIKARVDTALARVGLADLAARYPHQLSGGEQQRVALARALIYEPAVLLLDEPLSNLDAKLRAEARVWLRQLIVSLDVSTLFVTHDQIEAMAIADRVALLNAGTIAQEGAPSDLYQEPANLFAAEFMGSNNRLDGTLTELAGKKAVIEVLGVRLEGIARARPAIGEKATGVIRVEKTLVGGGPGPNRVPMTLKMQMYLGERWELLFVRDTLSVRAYASGPLRHAFYHVEFPPQSLWIF